VADLAVAVTIDWLVSSVVHWSNGGGHRGVDSVMGHWVGNHWGSMDSMSNNWGSVDSMSNNWGSMVSWGNHGGSMVSGSNLDNGSGLVGWGRLVGWGGLVGWLLGVDSSSLVGDLSNIAVISVGSVGHLLDPAVGESHSVGTLDIAGTIGGLLSVEVGLGVVISNGICEGVGGDLIGVFLGLVSGGGLVSNRGWGISGSSLHNHRSWGISWGSNNWSSMDSMMSNNWSSMDSMMNQRGGVVNSVSDGMMGHWMDCVVGDRGNSVVRDDGGLSYGDWPVGSNGGLDLSQTLGVVHLAH